MKRGSVDRDDLQDSTTSGDEGADMKPTPAQEALAMVMGMLGVIAVVIGLVLILSSYAQSSPGPMGRIGALFGLCALVPGAVMMLLTWLLWRRGGRRGDGGSS